MQAPTRPRAAGLQQRVEDSRFGRAGIVVVMLVVVAGMVFWNLPDSELKRVGIDTVRPVMQLSGLDQNWKVFSPNPRRINIDFHANVTFADGSTEVWRIPSDKGVFVAPYRSYRWRKWLEYVRADDQRNQLWEHTAAWIGTLYPDRDPVQVELVRRWFDTPGPGTGGVIPAWNEFTYYRYDVLAGTGEDLA